MHTVVSATRSAWSDFEFAKFQSEIGETASIIASAQEQGLLSRKKLVDVFLQFRNSASEDVKKAAASVLKCFQSEVDSLTARSKQAEDAFLLIYQRLAEMPDPSLALAEVETMKNQAQRASDLKIENSRLRETVDELKLEVNAAKSMESALRAAESRVEELTAAVEAAAVAEEAEQRTAALLAEARAHSEESDRRADALSEALKTAQSRVFELQSHLEEVKSAKTKELEILVNDLERANERIAVLQQESQNSEPPDHKISAGQVNSNTTETIQLLTRIEELESEVERQKEEIAELVSQLHSVETARKDESKSLQGQIESLQSALAQSEQQISSLRTDLSSKGDYDAIKRELEVLRSIEFQQQADEGSSIADEPLEFRLRRKNDQLQNRIASISAENDRIEEELRSLRESHSELIERDAQQKSLIARLEEDLNRASTWRPYQSQQAIDNNSKPPGMQEDALLNNILSEGNPSATPDSSVLSIVQNQRDRLREQNRELEENLLAMRQRVMAAQTELESLRRDNVQLYEKIRFVQNYASTSHNAPPPPHPEAPDTVLARYSNAYEEQLNPFKQFGQEERHRRYQALQPHEKIMHSLGRMIVNNRGARLATFAYTLAMHLLVFLVLYKLVTATEPICPAPDQADQGGPQ